MPEINPLRITPPPGTPEANNPLAPDWMRSVGSAAADWMQRQHTLSQQMGREDPATGLPTQRGLLNALAQYPGALVAGSGGAGGPGKGMRAFHGSMSADLEKFDPVTVGSGAMADRWAEGTEHAGEYYLTTNAERALAYGPNVHEFEITQPLYNKDAKAELEAWAKDQGYDSAQEHLDKYYDGNIFSALDLDNYLKDALGEATQAGFPGVHVSLGDLKETEGRRKVPVGDFIVLSDPSAARKVAGQ